MLPQSRFRAPQGTTSRNTAVNKKRQLLPGSPPASPSHWELVLPLSYSSYPRPGAGILTCFPFAGGLGAFRFENRITHFTTDLPSRLRIDSPMSNCCSHGTLLHFSLQSSHLNICYYHQDLH